MKTEPLMNLYYDRAWVTKPPHLEVTEENGIVLVWVDEANTMWELGQGWGELNELFRMLRIEAEKLWGPDPAST